MASTSQARDSIELEAGCDEIVVDISSYMAPAEWPDCCIYRVPKQLRKVNEEAYTPKLVSIGPFHHGREEFRDMETYKPRYFKDFFQRDMVTKSQKDLVQIIKGNEEKIRHCYSEEDRRESKDFVRMILLDAIFIIELFLKVKEADKETDYILSKPWLKTGILHDLILLENQLPFFVLEKLYMSAVNDSSSCNHCEEGRQIEEHKKDLMKQDAPFVKLSRYYFDRYDQKREAIIGEKVEHFTDLLRYLFCPPDMEQYWTNIIEQWKSEEVVSHSSKKKEEESSGTRFCATKLDDAGLEFKEVKEDRRLLDITLPGVLGRSPCLIIPCLCACFPCLICLMCFPCFMKCLLQLTLPGCFGRPMHILKIPHLVIDGYSEAIFRNLMALEQCHYPSKTYICSYALLLDGLIDTEKDVDLLVHKKVIVNKLGSNAIVMDLINKLSDHIVVTPSSYFDYIGQNLNKHYEFPLNHSLATLTREYFPNVFRGIATVVGLIILGFSFWNFIRPYVGKK